MKQKLLMAFITLLSCEALIAQQNPTGTAQTGSAGNPTQAIPLANSAWYRGGNNPGGTAGLSNIFGTMWNSPIYTVTDGALRMKLNGVFNAGTQYTINGFGAAQGVNTSGYLLIGRNANTQMNGTNLYVGKGAFSLLHLNGNNGGFVQEEGYRPWMHAGMTITDNQDLSYFGIRRIGTGNDLSETVIAWSDNQGAGFGPDVLSIKFTSGSGTFSGNDADLAGTDNDGREIMRMMPTGNVGIGPRFSNAAPPQSLLHINSPNNSLASLQLTTETGTGQSANDGFRIETNTVPFSYALLSHQENGPIIFATDNDITPGGVTERMRITTVNAPLVSNPLGLINRTRVSISHGPLAINNPRSLLHLGYNVELVEGAGVTDGWRDWMDIGTLTSNGTDNIYVGLKNESGINSSNANRYDAIINWGDDLTDVNGPDYLRFIFTSRLGSGQGQSSANDGLEVMRLAPNGNVGIGDFSVNGLNQQPQVRLDIDGEENIRTVLQDNNLQRVLVWDNNNNGRVRWRDANTLGGGTSGFGFLCNDPNAAFTANRHVNLNDNNFYFEGNNNANTENNVGFGYSCGTSLKAKVDAYQLSTGAIAGRFFTLSNYVFSVSNIQPTGVQGISSGSNAPSYVGVLGFANSNTINYGIYGDAGNGTINRAGYFNGDLEYTGTLIPASDQMFKTNVDSLSNALDIIRNVMPKTYLFDTAQYSQFNFSARPQYGFIAQEVEQVLPELVHQSYHPGVLDSSNTNYIVQPTNYKSLNYNAFIPINTQAIKELDAQINRVRSEIDTLNTRNDSIRIIRDRETLSDQQLKTNVQTLSGSLNKVRQMRGITYNWNHSANPNLNLDSLTHIGFVAQEVNTVEPLLTFIDDSSYMHVNYQRFVPVLLQSIKELDNQVQQKDSIIQSLDSRLTQLEQLITQCCNAAQNRVNNNSQNEAIAMLEVTLSSKNVVVLNQNVPNPFAEQTSISFQIPEDVKYAQMIFTDNLGKIIKTMDVEQRGKGVITVFADDLSTGIYTYTLVIDGKAIDSKRMIKK